MAGPRLALTEQVEVWLLTWTPGQGTRPHDHGGAALRGLGVRNATDLDGGFRAWATAGLPTVPGGTPALPWAGRTGTAGGHRAWCSARRCGNLTTIGLRRGEETTMAVLGELVAALRSGAVEVIDLTAPLTDTTPVLVLPEPFANTSTFRLEELSRYDDRGPGWYWNDIHTGEHTGTHLDAPIHWITGRDGGDISQLAPGKLVAPAAVLDLAGADPDFLLEIDHVRAWEQAHGPLPDGGWLLYRTGWDTRAHSQEEFLNADATGPHTPGVSVECARWLAEETQILGLGVETVGTDAGTAHSFEPAFPCHTFLLGAGKYGLTQLCNLQLLPPTGAVLVTGPLPIVGGSGSPTRVLALVER